MIILDDPWLTINSGKDKNSPVHRYWNFYWAVQNILLLQYGRLKQTLRTLLIKMGLSTLLNIPFSGCRPLFFHALASVQWNFRNTLDKINVKVNFS
jgi:hypothetical protein